MKANYDVIFYCGVPNQADGFHTVNENAQVWLHQPLPEMSPTDKMEAFYVFSRKTVKKESTFYACHNKKCNCRGRMSKDGKIFEIKSVEKHFEKCLRLENKKIVRMEQNHKTIIKEMMEKTNAAGIVEHFTRNGFQSNFLI